MNPPVHGATEEDGIVRLTLDRHQRRREQGVPTLTVLVGVMEEAMRAWQDWVDLLGLVPARTMRMDEEDARQLSSPKGTMLYLCTSGDGVRQLAEFVEKIGRFLAAQGTAQAGTVIGIAVARADADAYLRDEPHSRTRAMFAEGIVDLPVAAAARRAGTSERAVALLAGQGVRPETVEGFKAAAAARQQTVSPSAGDEEAEDRARSAAERFLFDLLGDLPETAGLFALNVRLGFCFGPMPAEVDLLAASLRLAVEIDGFHHFRAPENYRRDRRKDALLQKQGYLVLRFLAEDVVVRLEDILEEIRSAVAFRRATQQ